MIALRLSIHGKVQGVWYRDWTVENARALGLCGWVRNEVDRSVSAHLEGEEASVRRMIDRMYQGPPRAQVDRIEEFLAETEGFPSFDRR